MSSPPADTTHSRKRRMSGIIECAGCCRSARIWLPTNPPETNFRGINSSTGCRIRGRALSTRFMKIKIKIQPISPSGWKIIIKICDPEIKRRNSPPRCSLASEKRIPPPRRRKDPSRMRHGRISRLSLLLRPTQPTFSSPIYLSLEPEVIVGTAGRLTICVTIARKRPR